jgi:hypothetical protein
MKHSTYFHAVVDAKRPASQLVQSVLSALDIVPLAQSTHSAAPMALYVPNAHCVQFLACRKPTLLSYRPAMQLVHDPDSANEYCPLEQFVQPLARSMLNVPARQMSQSAFVDPSVAVYRPAMQFVQVVEFSCDAVPLSHAVQSLARAALYVPAGHTEHSAAPRAANLPPAQSVQAVAVPLPA